MSFAGDGLSYATPAELRKRFDERDIAQLASDSGAPAGSIDSNSYVLQALEDASGDIDAALLVGGRYTAAQLAALTGNALALLERMTCELAMTYLMERRPNLSVEDLERFGKIRDRHLERLRKGENIFGLTGQIEAGQPTTSGPTALEVQNLNLTRAYSEGHYYPRRRDPR